MPKSSIDTKWFFRQNSQNILMVVQSDVGVHLNRLNLFNKLSVGRMF